MHVKVFLENFASLLPKIGFHLFGSIILIPFELFKLAAEEWQLGLKQIFLLAWIEESVPLEKSF